MLELNLILAAVHELHDQRVRVDDFSVTLTIVDFPELHELAGAAREPLDDGVLEPAESGEVDARLAEVDAPRFRATRLVHDVRHAVSDVGTAPTADGPLPERTTFHPAGFQRWREMVAESLSTLNGAPPLNTTPCCEDERASTTARVAV